MTNIASAAVALAVRLHRRDGSTDPGDEAHERLTAAAALVGAEFPELLGAPSPPAEDGRLLCTPASPGAALRLMLALADELRPRRPTFSLAVEVSVDPDTCVRPAGFARDSRESDRGDRTPSLSGSIIAQEGAARAAVLGLESTDPRAARARISCGVEIPTLGALASMIIESYDSMTERQRQIVALTKTSDSQQRVASHLDVSRQAVNQSLAAAGWQHLRTAERVLTEALDALTSG